MHYCFKKIVTSSLIHLFIQALFLGLGKHWTSKTDKIHTLMGWGFPGGTVGKESTCLPMQETQELRVPSLGQEDSLEEEMATHSSILAWKIPWSEEPGGLQRMGLQSQT